MQKLTTLAMLLAVSLAASAQNDTRRARITGGGGDQGKCTIEVEVDTSAEISISGDEARVRGFDGRRASFRRFECNMVMPRNPNNFEFKGVDGRGSQRLITDPRNNRTAVIRIEDPKDGSEGYTFDIMWRGGSGGSGGSGGGFPGQGGSGQYDNRAVRRCEQQVRQRLRSDGYRNVDIQTERVNDSFGNRDTIRGEAFSRRGSNDDRFNFSCAVDRNGDVRDVRVDRR